MIHQSTQRLKFAILILSIVGAAVYSQFASASQSEQPDRIQEFRYAIIQVPGLGGGLDFVWGTEDGKTRVPGCPIALGISNAKLARTALTNSEGVAMFRAKAGPGARGAEILMQAAVPSQCEATNLKVVVFD